MIAQFALFVVLALIARAHALPPQRISGGEDAAPGEFPYQVSLRIRGYHICGGSIISDRHILTAAHCCNKHKSLREFTVVTGALWNRRDGQKHRPLHIEVHANFSESALKNDIAIIYLASPIEFSDTQNKINLPSAPPLSHVMATVSGWGLDTMITNGTVGKLKKLQVETFTSEDCGKRWSPWAPVLDDQTICIWAGNGRSPCSGDSGSPTAYNGQLVGIFAHGFGCPTTVPVFSVNVYHYLDWITMMMDRLTNMGDK